MSIAIKLGGKMISLCISKQRKRCLPEGVMQIKKKNC